MLDRVIDDVGDRLTQHQTIGGDRHAIGHAEREPLIPLVRENPERGYHVASELPQIDRFAQHSDSARVSVRQTQPRVDEIRQAIDRGRER